MVNAGFNAVFAAEKAGANITSLLDVLNNASLLLAQAEMANRTGDYKTTVAQADNVILMAQPVATQAQIWQSAADTSSRNAFWSTVAFTIVTAVVFVIVLIEGWIWLKRRYMKNVLEAKPEVPS